MHRRTFVPWLVSILWMVGCSSAPSAPSVSEGDRLLVEGKVEEALAVYRTALEESPEDLDARLRVGRCLIELDRREEGIEVLTTALEFAGEEADDARLAVAQLLMRQGRPGEVIDWLGAMVEDSDARLLVVRGQAQLALGRLDEAVESFDRVDRGSADARTFTILGTGYYLAGMRSMSRSEGASRPAAERGRRLLARARLVLQESLYLDPTDFTTHYTLGQLYHQTGRVDPAILEYRWAQRIDPAQPHPGLLLGDIYFRRGQFESAVVEFEAARRLGATGWPSFFLGMAYWALERRVESVGAFGRALVDDPQLEREVHAWIDEEPETRVPGLIALLEEGGQEETTDDCRRLLEGYSGEGFGLEAARWRGWWSDRMGGSSAPEGR